MAKKPPYDTPRDKMDAVQVARLITDIISADDPKEKKCLIAFNESPRKKASKKKPAKKK
jgi:hypothetical protein